jgi:hypothetical protein
VGVVAFVDDAVRQASNCLTADSDADADADADTPGL